MAAGGPLDDGKYPDFDVSKPNVARVYDAMLGGKDNFAADREFVAEVLRFAPMAPLGAISNRQFLRRVVQYLVVEAGVTQFIDLGSGLPTQGNVSEVAHQYNPQARVVHVDNDPVVYTHSKALLADAQTTDFILGDVRRPREILTDPVVESMIDFGQPVGLLLFAVLHHIEDSDHPERIMAALRAAMPSGSYLGHLQPPAARARAARAARAHHRGGETAWPGPSGACGGAMTARSAPGSAGWELVPPGLVPLGDWRPPAAGHAAYPEIQQSFSGGVARKR